MYILPLLIDRFMTDARYPYARYPFYNFLLYFMSNPVTDFPQLTTERCLLRQIQQTDRPALFAGLSHPDVIAYYGISYASEEATQEQLEWYRAQELNHSGIWWAICLPTQTGQNLIGACGIYEIDDYNRNADIGYWLLPEYWGTGIMQECLRCILAYGFHEKQLHRIEAEVEHGNLASVRLLQKLEFRWEGRRQQVALRDDHFVDLNYYALLAPNFQIPALPK
jgi:ribosomal-protein-alanine N-acetyltransferase